MVDCRKAFLFSPAPVRTSAVAAQGWSYHIFTLLDLCVSSLHRGHANLLCIVPILADDPRRESEKGWSYHMCVYIYIYIYCCCTYYVYVMYVCVYIYIYMYREREIDR